MKRELRRWEIVGFIATGLFGTLLHFVYEWTGGNRVIAVFSAVNESTWEHMKLLFIPFLVFTVVEFIVFSEAFRNFFAVKAASILLGLVTLFVVGPITFAFERLCGGNGKAAVAFLHADGNVRQAP